MKLQLLSDLHNEFTGYTWNIPETDANLIVLAGDIGNGIFGVEWAIRQSEKLNKPVLFIFGNHDFYNDDFSLISRAREYTKNSQVLILEKGIFEFHGYRILGTTLWTDFLLYGPDSKKIALRSAEDFMADYRHIFNNHTGHMLTPEDTIKLYEESYFWLNQELNKPGKNIVITHHIPTAWGSHPKYRGDMLTPAFCSDLEEFIIEHKPLLWYSGHSHFCYRKQIGETLCLSNTRGYPKEGIMHFDPNLVVEI